MKNLLLLMLTATSFRLTAAELDSITMIVPTSYTKPSALGQTVTSKVMAGAAATFNIDIEKKVMEKIEPYKDDLQDYFPKSGELDKFVKSIIQEGKDKYLGKVTDQGLINFYNHLGNKLIGGFADKILEKEGVTDPKRRDLWVKKITEPFNDCIRSSKNSQFDADHCIDALSTSLVPSAGIGIVYELSRASLNSSLPANQRDAFNKDQTDLYKNCIAKTKATATDVKACALASMKTGVQKVTDLSLSKTIDEKSSSKFKADSIKRTVWPSFEVCAQQVGFNTKSKVSYTDQFMNCIDTLVQNTGSLLVQDKISATPAVLSALSPAEAKQLAIDKSNQFSKCADDQKKKNARKDGMLDISVCENRVTNEVTYKVVSETLKDTAATSLKKDKTQSLKVGQEGVQLLDKCWNNQQAEAARENCLRKTIVAYSQKVATLKLNEAIPTDMPNRSNLNSSSVNDLAKCLDKNLPASISESNDLNKRLGSCTGTLTRNVALKVADFQIRSTAKGNLSPEETDKLAKKMVDGEFAKCIGDSPEDSTLDKCGNDLTAKAAKQITEISFAKEVNAYLEKAGGAKAVGLTQEDVDHFISTLNETTQVCIDKKDPKVPVMMDKVNTCIKGSIKKIAFFFGDIQFNKSVGDMYKGRDEDKKKVETQFKASLESCLGAKDSSKYSISDYTKNLYTCSDSVSNSTTLVVGQDQIDTSLNLYLKDRPENNMSAKRAEIRNKVIGDFKSCMSAGKIPSEKCIDNLKREATQTIVVNYGRVETKSQLNADEVPKELKPVEDKFVSCTTSKLEGDALAKHLDECTKEFALGFAKALGELKLNYLLKQALGGDEFKAQKGVITESIAKYNQCLEGLKKYNMNDGLTDKLTVCTDMLTDRGMSIVRNSISGWMTTEQKDAATMMIKREFAVFLPCLSALLPTSPYDKNLADNVESSVKPLAVLLSHYIEYNPEVAQDTLHGIIQKLSVDLNDVAQTDKAKRDLLDFLYEKNAMDQFIKSVVRGTVKDALANVPEKDVPKEIRDVLLKKQNFEDIFNSPEGVKIKEAVMEKLLKPALVDKADLRGAAFKGNMEAIKDNVVKLLINSPDFGEQAIKMGIQKQINEMNKVTKFVAKVMYGGQSLQWDKVRESDDGKKAEAYIKDYVLLPKFKGEAQTPEEQKKVMEEAEKLVVKAVKSYG